MKNKIAILLITICFAHTAMCQKADSDYAAVNLSEVVPAVIENGDTVPFVNMNPVFIIDFRQFKTYADALKYYELVNDVKTVYPYAILAEATFEQCAETIKGMTSKSKKRQYIKKVEKQLMAQYSDELKGLTVDQGRLLTKLINRETGQTSYELVKELRGSFSAFMWQTVASVFGDNLKNTYNAAGEDKEIESIINLIEAGAI